MPVVVCCAKQVYNSLAPGRFGCDFKNSIFNLILLIGILRSLYDNAFRWMPRNITDDKSTLIQVMAWCHQATSHYLSQCWPRSMSPYGVIRPQLVNLNPNQSLRQRSTVHEADHFYHVPKLDTVIVFRQCCHFDEISLTGCTGSCQMTISRVASDNNFTQMVIFLFKYGKSLRLMWHLVSICTSPSPAPQWWHGVSYGVPPWVWRGDKQEFFSSRFANKLVWKLQYRVASCWWQPGNHP